MSGRVGADVPQVEQGTLAAQLAHEQRKVEALQDIGAALASTLDLNELLSLVLARITEVSEADRGTLYLIDEDTGELWSKITQGETTHEIRLKLGEGLAGWVGRTGRSVNIKDAYEDQRFDQEWDRRTGYHTRSILCVPMKNHHGRILGVVQLLNKNDGHFTQEDESLLSALASQAAMCVENSKLFLSVVGKNMELLETKDQLERKVRELDVLFEISNLAASAQDLDELLERVLRRAMDAVDAEAAAILIAEPGTGDLQFRKAVGGDPEAVGDVRIPAGDGIAGWVASHGESQIVNDLSKDARHSRQLEDQIGYHPRSLLCVPLKWEDGAGALELLNKGQGEAAFTADDLRFANAIGQQISSAIALARVKEEREQEERLSTIGQLLSGVLHDLKTPITVISGAVQLMVSEPQQLIRQSHADRVVRQVGMINSLVRETLAFARGETSLWVRKVYLTLFFKGLEEQLRQEFRGRRMDVRVELQDRGIAHFDQHKVQRAIHNLARNAAEALSGRAGELCLVVTRRQDGQLSIAVTDNGPGIPAELKGRLFDSFTTHGKLGGTGLGLAIVRKIVMDHGGSIDVDSEPGRTTFTLVLPDPVPRERRG